MGDQRPRRRVEGEVVVPRDGRERQHELAAFDGVVQKRRQYDMRRRLQRRFHGRREPDVRPTFRHREEAAILREVLDHLQPPLVQHQSRVADDLFLLEIPDHISIVGRRQPALFRNLLGERLHLVLNLGERLMRRRDEPIGRDIDARIPAGSARIPRRTDGSPGALSEARTGASIRRTPSTGWPEAPSALPSPSAPAWSAIR